MFDANECTPPKSNKPSFFGALDFTSALFNDRMGYAYRWQTEHIPMMINKRIMSDLQRTFSSYYNETSSHHTRQRNELQYQFAYTNWIVEAPQSDIRAQLNTTLYKWQTVDTTDFRYLAYGNGNVGKANNLLEKTLKERDSIRFLCVNDLINYRKSDSNEKLVIIRLFYQNLYPYPSKYEL